MMVKLGGALLLLAAGMLWGFSRSGRLKRRAASLHQLKLAVSVIKTQAYYGDAPLDSILQSAAQTAEGAVRELFMRLSRSLAADRFLLPEAAAEQVLGELAGSLALLDRDKQAVLFLVEKLGRLRRAAQDNYLSLSEAELAGLAAEAELAAEKKSRLYLYGGICGSLLLIILAI